MKLIRYVGDEVKISPTFEDMEIFWVTCEKGVTSTHSSSPSTWFKYGGWIYLMVCDYEFSFLEQYSDWSVQLDDGSTKEFSEYYPTKLEIDYLLRMNPTFFKANPEEIYKSELGYYCKYELDFITEWNRSRKINDILP